MSNDNQISVELSLALQEFFASLTKLQGDFGAAMKGMGTQASASGRQIDDAFGVVGVRSSAKIQAEIREIDQALQRLGMDAKVTGQDFDRAWSAGQSKLAALHAELNGANLAAGKAASGAAGLGANMGALGGIASSVGPMIAAAFGAQHFIEVNVQAESLRRCLTQLTGSQQAAAAEMDYIRSAANRMGLEVQTAASSYMSLMASTRGTALEGEQTRRIFEAVAGAMGMMGKSSAETNNALMAVSQMASKGTVAMEELRGQLGEALPGALKAAADGMGVPTQKLIEMVESGNVLAKDLLPRLADGLEKSFGTSAKVDGVAAAWNRLKNSIDNVFTNIGQSGVMESMAKGMDYVAVKVNSAWLGFEALGKGIGIVAGAIATFTNPSKALGEMLDEQRRKAALAGESFGLEGEKLDEFRKKIGLTQEQIDKLNGKQSEASAASQAAGRASAEASVAQAKLVEGLKDTAAQTERAAKASSTYAEAVKQAGANAVAVAQLYGTEADAKQASVKASEDYAKAVQQDLASQEALLSSKQALLTELKNEAAVAGEVSQKKKDEIKALEDGVAAQTAAVAKARELAESSELAARKSELAAQTYGDQSSRLGEYGSAVDAARAKIEQMHAAQAAGKATEAQVAEATDALREATVRYRDALSDATKAAERHVQQIGQQASLEQATLGVEKARYQAIADVAKARGDEIGAANAMRRVREIEIQMQEAQVKVCHAQAKAILAAAQAKEAELIASGKLTDAAKAEIDARIQEAKIKELEAEKAEILVEKLKELALTEDDVRAKGDGAADGLRDSFNGAADASDRLNRSIKSRPSVSPNPNTGISSTGAGGVSNEILNNGVTTSPNTNGFGNFDASGTRQVGVYKELLVDMETEARKSGLRGDQVAKFMSVIDGYVKDEEADSLNPGILTTDQYINAMHGAFIRARDKAIEYAKRTAEDAVRVGRRMEPSGGGSSHTLTLNINGKSQTVNMSSESDVEALISMLESAAGSSS